MAIMVCRVCGRDAMRRKKRKGLLQMRFFPLLGLYPWECCFCRTVRLYRKKFERVEQKFPDPSGSERP